MNRIAMVGAIALCFATGGVTQSLSELAKKEKERRQENAEEGRRTVLEAEGAGAPPKGEMAGPRDGLPQAEIETRGAEGPPEKEPFVPRSKRVQELLTRIEVVLAEHEKYQWPCAGGAYGADELGNWVSVIVPPNPQACKKLEELAKEYEQLHFELRALDRYLVMFHRFPKAL